MGGKTAKFLQIGLKRSFYLKTNSLDCLCAHAFSHVISIYIFPCYLLGVEILSLLPPLEFGFGEEAWTPRFLSPPPLPRGKEGD